ncbi:hypothetical protein ACIPL1_01085 [Pseudomonas sp. NPDC090202]|uniref:hypothetical protein n=1 Tax=unclassified Pseudomonas TaxID=196821 RepID=UPI00380819D0
MRIDSLPNTNFPITPQEKPSPKPEVSTEANTSTTTPTSTVSISGQAVMRQRLFGSTSSYEPRVVTYKDGLDGISIYQYLTPDDRRLFGEIYEIAQEESVDLEYVDQLARELGDYRSHNDGKIMARLNQGNMYDSEGHKEFFSFTAVDAAVAKRIRESASLANTRLDKDFVKFTIDPDYSGLGHSDFAFLEFAVNRLSNGSAPIPVDPVLKQFRIIEKNYVRTLSKEVYSRKGDKKPSTAAERHQALLERNRVKKTKPAPAQNLSAILRNIVQKYLQTSGLTTLFDMIARTRR